MTKIYLHFTMRVFTYGAHSREVVAGAGARALDVADDLGMKWVTGACGVPAIVTETPLVAAVVDNRLYGCVSI